MFLTNPGGKYSEYYHVANGKIEEWRGSVTCPRSHRECGRSEVQTQAVRPQSPISPPNTCLLWLMLPWGRGSPLLLLALMAA